MSGFLTESSQKAFTIRAHVRKYPQDFFREALKAPLLSNVRFIFAIVCVRLYKSLCLFK